MSTIEHHATVDRGLKMKIKRKNVEKSKKDQNKSDTTRLDIKSQGETSQSANGMLADKTSKLSLFSDKEKSPKSKTNITKKDKGKGTAKGDSGASSSSNVNGLDSLFTQTSMEPKHGETPTNKKDCVPDPYEFNAKVEDGIAMPIKKLKMETKDKVDTPGTSSQAGQAITHNVATDTSDVAVVTEPECLGPCEPGTQVHLEGIVWHESENGVLVVNVTWRGKTYVGTLLDATRHDWAPPRLNCDSPSCDFESRTPKGRGKRRGASNTPVNETRTLRKGRRGSNQQTFTAPPSPARSDISVGGVKRKGRPQDIDLSNIADQRTAKRSRSASQVPTPNAETPPTDPQGYLECPEPNCNKKYKNANGLKYHQSHAHSGSNSNTSCEDTKDMDIEDVPLSVVKSTVKKEKDTRKDVCSNKKDNIKESNQSGDKSKDVSATRKSEKEEKDVDSDKDTGSKNEAKCDNIVSSKKKEKESANITPSKVLVSQSAPLPSNSKINVSQNMIPKSDSSVTMSSSSQVNASFPNTVQISSQITLASMSSSISVPSTATTLPSAVISSIAQPEAFKSDNKLVDIKPKLTLEARVTKANRPIVPAPTPVLANVQVTHSTLSPVMSHAQMSPQLKPIQPKPTIMGEPQNINPALADLNKDRKKLQKKRPKDGAQTGSSRSEQPTIKIERTGVIKTNPLPNKHPENVSGNKDSPRQPSDIRSQNPVSHLTPKGTDNHSRMNQNPHLLKVSSPIQASTPEHHKTPVNDDVQSPAYSDISDANESASPAAQIESSPQKQKEDPVPKKTEKVDTANSQTGETQSVPQHYGMYYYGQQQQQQQQQFGMSNMSPGHKNSGNTPSSVPRAPGTNPANKDPKRQGSEEKKIAQEDPPKVGDKKAEDKDSNRPKMGPRPGSGPPPNNLSPQQMHEYQMQQNWYQQQMYHMQSLPRHVQYQYMTNGWFPSMDSAYMQQMMEEQRRAQNEPGRNDREPGQGSSDNQGPSQSSKSGDINRAMDSNKGVSSTSSTPTQRKEDNTSHSKVAIQSSSQNLGHERVDNIKTGESDKMKEQAHKEKQNENLQFLKENRELKTEMERQQEYERFRQAEEMRRYKMYQEQKMIEERKKNELSRKGENRPESLVTKAPGTKPILDHAVNPRSAMNIPRGIEDIHRDTSGIKREGGIVESKGKDTRDSHSRESSVGKYPDTQKQGEEKSKTPVSEKLRPEGSSRNPETLKHRPGGSSSKSGSPSTSVSSNVPGSPSYHQSFVNNYQYMQNPQFMGVDPSHPLYRSHSVNPALVSGFPGQYIHPSQVNYRPGMDDVDKEKANAQKLATSSDSDLKKVESSNRGPFYSSTHKIHELSEKARPRSRNSSPCPTKATDPAVSTSYDKHRDFTNSPPTQRHVHTHHHTHVLQSGIQPPLPPATGIPVYDPYGAMFVGPAQSPHPFPPK